MKKLLGSAFFWFVLLLVGLELIAWYALPYRGHPTADRAFRNPTDHRAWPEYLDVGPPRAGERLVVLLSASPAVGKEIEDSSRIYPALVRRGLAERDQSLHFENWATGGTRTVDIELLTMKAVERRPALVVMGFSYRNFDPPHKLNLDFPFTDVNLFAGDPRLWPYLEDTTFAENTEIEDVLYRSALLGSNLVRSRIAVTDAVVERIPLDWHRWVVGRFVRPRPRLDEMRDPSRSIFWADQTDALAEWQLIEDRREAVQLARGIRVTAGELAVRRETFESFCERLVRRFAASGTRYVWVWLPMDKSKFQPPSLARVQRFYRETCDIVERSGVRCHDLHAAIPVERFVTPGHYDEPGHEQMGRLMLEVIDRELEAVR